MTEARSLSLKTYFFTMLFISAVATLTFVLSTVVSLPNVSNVLYADLSRFSPVNTSAVPSDTHPPIDENNRTKTQFSVNGMDRDIDMVPIDNSIDTDVKHSIADNPPIPNVSYLKLISSDNRTKAQFKWKVMLPETGVGNRLDMYWMARAVPFWFDCDFEFVSNNCKSDPLFCALESNPNKTHFSKFLPRQSQLTVQNMARFINQTSDSNTTDIGYRFLKQFYLGSYGFVSNIKENNPRLYQRLDSIIQRLFDVFNHLYSYKLRQMQSFITEQISKTSSYNHAIPHGFPLYITIYNSLFMNVIQIEYILGFEAMDLDTKAKSAEKSFYQYSENMKDFESYASDPNSINIAVHLRCGDVMCRGKSLKAPSLNLTFDNATINAIINNTNDTDTDMSGYKVRQGSGYGFTGLTYYKEAMDIFRPSIGNATIPVTVWLVLPMDVSKARGRDANCIPKCMVWMDTLLPYFKEIFAPYQVRLLNDGSMDTDFYTLTRADFVICSSSTYCISGVLGNANAFATRDTFGDSWMQAVNDKIGDTAADHILPSFITPIVMQIVDMHTVHGLSVEQIAQFMIDHR